MTQIVSYTTNIHTHIYISNVYISIYVRVKYSNEFEVVFPLIAFIYPSYIIFQLHPLHQHHEHNIYFSLVCSFFYFYFVKMVWNLAFCAHSTIQSNMMHALMDIQIMSIIIEKFQQSIKFSPRAKNDWNRFIVRNSIEKVYADVKVLMYRISMGLIFITILLLTKNVHLCCRFDSTNKTAWNDYTKMNMHIAQWFCHLDRPTVNISHIHVYW